MKLLFVFLTTFLSLFIKSNFNKVIYVMNDKNRETVEEIIDNCNVKDDVSSVTIKNIETNYHLDVGMGEYYIRFEAYDEVGNKSNLEIIVIIVPNKMYEYYTTLEENESIDNIISNIGLSIEDVTIINDSYTNSNKEIGLYKVELNYNLINDYKFDINIVVLKDKLNDNNTIIYPLYNKINKEKLKELISINLNINIEDIYSVKENIDIYHEGKYEVIVNVCDKVYNITFIIKEMLPKRLVTFNEKLYIYLTIFFNIDSRYKTTNFWDIKTRIKYISEIYRTNYIRY